MILGEGVVPNVEGTLEEGDGLVVLAKDEEFGPESMAEVGDL